MYSGLLPRDLTEDDLSPDEEEQHAEEKPSTGHVSVAAENRGSLDDGESSQTGSDAGTDSQTGCMPGTSREMWQKFQELRKKKEEIKTVKIHENAKEGAEKEEIVRSLQRTSKEGPYGALEQQAEREQHWKELKQYFGVNDRFQPPACSKPPPKSGLEKSIEEAIAEGDVAKAEEMSDRLATREMAVQIARAADCRDFVQSKQEEEAARAAKKRKKQIAWGFEAKQRWETKSNMGFM